MRRIALISSVLLPLPFAALPLAAVLFAGEPAVTEDNLAITTDFPETSSVTTAVSLATGPSPESPCGDFSNVT